MQVTSLSRRLASEALGSALLLAAVVGSGIMGAKLSGGNVGLALLANSLATGSALFVLITIFGPVSGAHFNPAVTAVMRLKGEIDTATTGAYMAAQVGGALAGVVAAHAMFELPLLQASTTARTGAGQWIAEAIAAFGLVVTIFGTLRARAEAVATAVALYILSAYWFTASTSFANPAVTLARAATNTFAGIAPVDVWPFIVAQLVGAVAGFAASSWLFGTSD